LQSSSSQRSRITSQQIGFACGEKVTTSTFRVIRTRSLKAGEGGIVRCDCIAANVDRLSSAHVPSPTASGLRVPD